MAIEIWNALATNKLAIDSQGQARAILYDAAGNPVISADMSRVPSAQGGLPIMGLDSQQILRAVRSDQWGVIKGSQSQIIWWDPVETPGSQAPNLNLWTKTTLTMTVASAATDPVQILNNGSSFATGTYAILTSVAQFAHFGRLPLVIRGRLKFKWAMGAQLEFGFGKPATAATAAVDGVFFRMKNDGTFIGVFSSNSDETEVSLGAPAIDITKFYDCAIYVDDDFVRWVVTDANNVPIVDVTSYLSTAEPSPVHVTHLSAFAKIVNVTATSTDGVATAAQLIMGQTTVELLDTTRNKLWHHTCSVASKNSVNNPLTGITTPYYASISAPSAVTPSNSATAATYQLLGGVFEMNATGTSENDLSIFAYQVPVPYSLYITGINIPIPLNVGAAIAGTDTVIEWGYITNATTSAVSTGGGQRMSLPGYHRCAVSTPINSLYVGSDILYTLGTPIVCLPGLWFMIVYRMVLGTATSLQVIRGMATIDGYFE